MRDRTYPVQVARSLAGALLWLMSVVAYASAPTQFAGTWALHIDPPKGAPTPKVHPPPPLLNLEQKGVQLTGTYRGAMGSTPLLGSVQGKDNFKVTVTQIFQGKPVTVVFDGRVKGDRMSGKVSSNAGEWNFIGRRQPVPKVQPPADTPAPASVQSPGSAQPPANAQSQDAKASTEL